MKNPREEDRAPTCRNRHPRRRECCETQQKRNCDSRGRLSFRSESTRDRRARKTTALEIEIKICVCVCASVRVCIRACGDDGRSYGEEWHSWYCGGRVGRGGKRKGPTDSSVQRDCEELVRHSESMGHNCDLMRHGDEQRDRERYKPFKLVSEVPSTGGGVKPAHKEDSRHERDAENNREKPLFSKGTLFVVVWSAYKRIHSTLKRRRSMAVNVPRCTTTLPSLLPQSSSPLTATTYLPSPQVHQYKGR